MTPSVQTQTVGCLVLLLALTAFGVAAADPPQGAECAAPQSTTPRFVGQAKGTGLVTAFSCQLPPELCLTTEAFGEEGHFKFQFEVTRFQPFLPDPTSMFAHTCSLIYTDRQSGDTLILESGVFELEGN